MGLDRDWAQDLEYLQGCNRLGIYGGTFDPVHIGHLIVAEEALHIAGLDQVLFVPARVSPLKQDSKAVAARDRLEMVRLATADNPRFSVSDIDISREGPSFTVETLEMLTAALPHTELCFIMGMDSVLSFHRWKSPERITELAKLVIVTRPGSQQQAWLQDTALQSLIRDCIVIDSLQIGISSTDIRARVHSERPIRYQVPTCVESYIHDMQLYTQVSDTHTLRSLDPSPRP